MSKKLKPIPAFANEEEERLFWETHDSFDYVDWDNTVRVGFPNLKPPRRRRRLLLWAIQTRIDLLSVSKIPSRYLHGRFLEGCLRGNQTSVLGVGGQGERLQGHCS